MKTLLLISLAILSNQSEHFAHPILPPSDLEIGKIGPRDKVLINMTKIRVPVHNFVFKDEFGMYNSSYTFSYLTAKEYGNHPDARIKLVNGGPGTTGFSFQIDTGDTGGWNYTITGYGKSMANSISYNWNILCLCILITYIVK